MYAFTDLSNILNVWIRRLRMQRVITWLLRGIEIGLAIALVGGVVGPYEARVLREEYLLIVIASVLLVPVVSGVIAFMWRIRTIQAARYFDQLLHLDERISTALELQQNKQNHIPADIIDHQLQDAIRAAKAVNIRKYLPIRLRFQEAIVAISLFLLIGAVWFRGGEWFNAAAQARAVEKAVAVQAAEIDQLIQQISTNDALSDQQKQNLINPLREARKGLQENPSLENSVSILTSTGEQLRTLSDAQSKQVQQTLNATGSQLAQQPDSPLQSIGKNLQQGNYVSAASQLQNINVDHLTKKEKQQLASQLDAMANAVQATNSELAQQLSQAADAIQSGKTDEAQKALSSAAKSLAQTGQQITFSEAAGQAASQLQNGAGKVLAAGGGQQQANQSGHGSSSNEQANGSGGAGAGSGSSADQSQTGTESSTSPIAQNNAPGNGGETSYEQIYAPSLLGGHGGPDVPLPGSENGNGDVTGQVASNPGDAGTSQVPYSEVYSQYEQINNKAIENGEVPSQFLDVIKNYFNSLKP